jgi:hypothetical protein
LLTMNYWQIPVVPVRPVRICLDACSKSKRLKPGGSLK